jgi:hypothetical protein
MLANRTVICGSCFPLTVTIFKVNAVRFLLSTSFDQLVIDFIKHEPGFNAYFG